MQKEGPKLDNFLKWKRTLLSGLKFKGRMTTVRLDWPCAYKHSRWPNLKNTSTKAPQPSLLSRVGVQSFLKRYGMSLKQKTKIAQKLLSEFEEKMKDFQRFVISKRKTDDFPLSRIGNMDETPMCFDMPSNKTLNQKDDKTGLIKTTGHEKNFAVVLSCTADGVKLPPKAIFKRNPLPQRTNFPVV